MHGEHHVFEDRCLFANYHEVLKQLISNLSFKSSPGLRSKGSWLDRISSRRRPTVGEDGGPLDIFSELKSAQQVLIVPSDRVGGLFLGAPVIKMVRQSYPNAHIGLLVGEAQVPIARLIPDVDEVVAVEFDQALWTGAFRKAEEELQRKNIDLLICLGFDCSYRLAQLCRGSGAKLRVGFARDGTDLFNVEVVSRNRAMYEELQYRSLLNAIGIQGEAEFRWSPVDENAEKTCEHHLGQGGRSLIVALDMSKGEGKGLNKRQFDDIVNLVVKRGARALLFFSLAEKKIVNYLKEKYGDQVIPCSADDLLVAAALVQRSQVLIAANTDILHLAVSLKAPVIGLFAENPARWIAAGNRFVQCLYFENFRAISLAEIVAGLDRVLSEKVRSEKTESG